VIVTTPGFESKLPLAAADDQRATSKRRSRAITAAAVRAADLRGLPQPAAPLAGSSVPPEATRVQIATSVLFAATSPHQHSDARRGANSSNGEGARRRPALPERGPCDIVVSLRT
jgi:hypothetical protein